PGGGRTVTRFRAALLRPLGHAAAENDTGPVSRGRRAAGACASVQSVARWPSLVHPIGASCGVPQQGGWGGYGRASAVRKRKRQGVVLRGVAALAVGVVIPASAATGDTRIHDIQGK